MIVTCAGCGTKYRVSDDKIGPLGVKVRCPKCRTVFEVRLPDERESESLAEKLFGKDVLSGISSDKAPSPESAATAPEAPAAPEKPPRRTDVPPPPQAASPAPEPRPRNAELAGREEPAAVGETAGGPEPVGARVPSSDSAEAETAGRPPAFPFKAPEEDPKTLARALVSDILFYNRESRDRGLAEGKTLAYLGREIARSWDTFKDRVGLETAVETEFFRQAVNEILGEGRVVL